MRRVGSVVGLVAAAMVTAGAANALDLPAGPNREVVARQCSACHDLQNLLDTGGLSREGWAGAIEEMTGYGLEVTAEQRAQILDYLSTYMGPRSADRAQ
jgi:hypothetical protein